LIIWL